METSQMKYDTINVSVLSTEMLTKIYNANDKKLITLIIENRMIGIEIAKRLRNGT